MHLIHLRCSLGFHAWKTVDHFPDGDAFPPGYTARRCERCDRVQWDLQNLSLIPIQRDWVNGWPPRSQTLQSMMKDAQGIWYQKPTKPKMGDIYKDEEGHAHGWDGFEWVRLSDPVPGTPIRSIKDFKVICKLDDGLWPEEMGRP